MIFDVMLKEGENENGKQVVNVYRVHDKVLSKYLREAQVYGKEIVGVIPLFANKRKEHRHEYENPVGELRPLEVDDVFVADREDMVEDDTRL